MAAEIELLTQLKIQLVDFFDELIESFPTEADFVIFRIFIQDQIPTVDIMNYIIIKLVPLQEMVRVKNENFFLENNILFEQFDEKQSVKVNHFRRLWLSDKIDNEDRETIWKWFRSFLFLANKYLELKKKST
jgi:hypothetical protein